MQVASYNQEVKVCTGYYRNMCDRCYYWLRILDNVTNIYMSCLRVYNSYSKTFDDGGLFRRQKEYMNFFMTMQYLILPGWINYQQVMMW